MQARSRPLLTALAIALIGGVVADCVAQEPPAATNAGDGFAAARSEQAAPAETCLPPPAAVPGPVVAPRSAPAPYPLGGWMPYSLPAPPFMGMAAPYSLPSVGYPAPTYKMAMQYFGRPQSLEPDYGHILDRQTPLPRADNAFLDRPLSPFLAEISPFGRTDIASYGPLYVGGIARGDAVVGTAQLSKPFSFIPGSIPVQGQKTFGLPQPATVQEAGIGTHLFLESYVTTEMVPPVRLFSQVAGFVQTDGSGSGQVPHLFGQLKSLIVGKADTFFSDPRAYPNTIDLQGPNALVYLQHMLIGYLWEYQWPGVALETGLSVEQPEPSVTPPDPKNASNFTSRSQIPDIAARARLWDPVWGHVQFASILRSIGTENLEYTTEIDKTKVVHPASNQQVIGWGVQATGMLHPFDGLPWIAYDLIGFGGSCGRGITSYYPDFGLNSGLDAVFDDKDQLRALPLTSFFTSYTHLWTPQLRSTVVYSQVDLKSFDSPDLSSSPYRRGRYFAANLIYEFDVTVSDDKKGRGFTGIEYLYGRHELLDGKYGDAHRVQFTAGAKY
jgi:hypothetical protein